MLALLCYEDQSLLLTCFMFSRCHLCQIYVNCTRRLGTRETLCIACLKSGVSFPYNFSLTLIFALTTVLRSTLSSYCSHCQAFWTKRQLLWKWDAFCYIWRSNHADCKIIIWWFFAQFNWWYVLLLCAVVVAVVFLQCRSFLMHCRYRRHREKSNILAITISEYCHADSWTVHFAVLICRQDGWFVISKCIVMSFIPCGLLLWHTKSQKGSDSHMISNQSMLSVTGGSSPHIGSTGN